MADNPEENIEAQQGDAEAGNSMERIINTNVAFSRIPLTILSRIKLSSNVP
jgi:hypothetical protein